MDTLIDFRQHRDRERSKRSWRRHKEMGLRNYTVRGKPEFLHVVKTFVHGLRSGGAHDIG